MEVFELRDEAARRIRVADHMLTTTYPLVKDPKILLSILDNIAKGMEYSMDSVLEHERYWKRIPPYPSTFDGRLAVFTKLVHQYGLPKEALRSLAEIRETLQEHQQSPVEFRRQEKFVICSEGYKVRTLTPEDLKRHLATAKEFIKQANRVTA